MLGDARNQGEALTILGVQNSVQCQTLFEMAEAPRKELVALLQANDAKKSRAVVALLESLRSSSIFQRSTPDRDMLKLVDNLGNERTRDVAKEILLMAQTRPGLQTLSRLHNNEEGLDALAQLKRLSKAGREKDVQTLLSLPGALSIAEVTAVLKVVDDPKRERAGNILLELLRDEDGEGQIAGLALIRELSSSDSAVRENAEKLVDFLNEEKAGDLAIKLVDKIHPRRLAALVDIYNDKQMETAVAAISKLSDTREGVTAINRLLGKLVQKDRSNGLRLLKVLNLESTQQEAIRELESADSDLG
jgi:hypothetical protein